MAYQINLNDNQQLIVANDKQQTLITSISSSSGQQQSQSNSFTTGNWQQPPQLYQTGVGFILQINSESGQHFIQIQSNSISTITAPQLNNAVEIEFKNIPDTTADRNNTEFKPMQGMQPMQPMQPMKMGNMSMDINTMSMQMGNMSLGIKKEQKTTSTTNFCPQCGTKVKTSDRFCGNCGNKLDN